MLKKISKKLIIFSSLFLTFFCFQNVNATTIYYQDDFDSYTANHLVDEYSNWYSTDEDSSFTPSVVSSSNHYTSAFNSLQFSYRNFIRYSFNSPYLTSFYVSADILLITPSSEGDPNYFSFGVGSYNYVDFSCNMDANGVLTGLVIHSSDYFYSDDYVVNQLCNGVFNNIGAYFEIDSLNNRIIVSSFINGELYSTTFHPSYNSTAFYDMSIGGSAMEPIYFDNFVIADELVGGSQEQINGSCGSDADLYSYYDNPPTNLCTTGTSDNFTFNGLAYQSGSAWTWDCLGENGGNNTSCVSYLDPNSKINGVCGDYANQDFQTVEDFNGFSPYNTYHKCSQGLYNSTSFVASVNTVSWYCTGINYGISAFCTAHLITPTTDAFDYSDFQVPDFYEDVTNKGWLVDALTWLFLPTTETLNDTFNIKTEFRGKAPHGYLTKFHDFFMSIVSESPEPIPFPELVVTPFAGTEPVTFFNFVSFVEIVGADNFSRFYHFLELLIGAVVIGYLVRRGIRFIKELK